MLPPCTSYMDTRTSPYALQMVTLRVGCAPRHLFCEVCTQPPKAQSRTLWKKDTSESPNIIEYSPGTRILVTRPLDVVIYDSTGSKRAWTFQEQILSRRCLIFEEGRIYFQCRFVGISEDIRTDSSRNVWSPNRTDSPLQSLDEMKRRPI